MRCLSPREHAVIEVDAEPDEIRRRLSASVDPRRLWVLPGAGMPLRGEVGRRMFSVSRAVQGHNSFQPLVDGEISSRDGGGSRVTLEFRTRPWVGTMVPLWFAAVAWFLLPTGYLLVTKGVVLPILAILFMAAFGAVVVRWGYRVSFPAEVKRTREILERILDGHERGCEGPGGVDAGNRA